MVQCREKGIWLRERDGFNEEEEEEEIWNRDSQVCVHWLAECSEVERLVVKQNPYRIIEFKSL